MSSPLSSHFNAQCYGFCSQGLVCAGGLTITATVIVASVWRDAWAYISFFSLFYSPVATSLSPFLEDELH